MMGSIIFVWVAHVRDRLLWRSVNGSFIRFVTAKRFYYRSGLLPVSSPNACFRIMGYLVYYGRTEDASRYAYYRDYHAHRLYFELARNELIG